MISPFGNREWKSLESVVSSRTSVQMKAEPDRFGWQAVADSLADPAKRGPSVQCLTAFNSRNASIFA